jgi:hypothetical protein
MTDETTIISDDRDGTGWVLRTRESERTGERVLEACKRVPYDGVLYYTTETRQHVSYRKNSQYNLSASDVIDHYEAKTGASVQTCKLCSWPVGSRGDSDTVYRERRFCSPQCDVKYDHLKADADAADARRAERE